MLRIVKDKAASLHAVSKAVELPLSPEDEALLQEMLAYLKDSQDPTFQQSHPKVREGIGLAAPQVGVNKRMLVIHYLSDPEKNEYITRMLVNPKIIANSLKKCYLESGEGCLSVDSEHPGYAYRDYKITVRAYDAINKTEIVFKATGFDAVVVQHEMDHLDGLLFYDRIDKENPYKKIPGSVAI